MRYDFITIIKLVAATFLPVLLSCALYLAEKKTRFGKIKRIVKQAIVGVLFGGVAVLGTEFGIPVGGCYFKRQKRRAAYRGAFVRRAFRNYRGRYRRRLPFYSNLLGRGRV